MTAFSIRRWLVSFLLAILILPVFSSLVSAQDRSYTYDSIKVDVRYDQDSTATITEELTYRFDGTYHAVYRDITLVNQSNLDQCRQNPQLQCGGFEFMSVISVKGNGTELRRAEENEISYSGENVVTPDDSYNVQLIDDGFEKKLRVQWVFSEPGQYFDNEQLTFTIEYKVFGSLGYFTDYDLFYWNTIFADREQVVADVNVDLWFPGDIAFVEENLSVVGNDYQFLYEYFKNENRLNLTTENLAPYEPFTILLKLPKGLVDKYATLNLVLTPDTQTVTYGDIVLEGVTDRLSGLPAGTTELTFAADGYYDETVPVDLDPGEEAELTVSLRETPLRMLVTIAMIMCNVLGCLITPAFLIWLYGHWRRKGADTVRNQTIVPEYSPPDKILPYLLGSLKDEKVDLVDITATIIDLAYRGYIKIKEVEKTKLLGISLGAVEYELSKLKEFTDLTATEQRIMTDIFGTSNTVSTLSLKNSFYLKIPGIKSLIYEEMVTNKFFDKNPDSVRKNYLGAAIAMILIGFGSLFIMAIGFTITLTFSLILSGFVLLFVSNHMPAKSELGSEVFRRVLGFKMYMETAERFRVQNLTPETFEKYLSYAIVFGIEKQWAEKFKDIYKGQPEWYQGNMDNFNTLVLVNALSNFNTTTASAMTVSPSSSGSSSGGGWSGGGGFSGGFSGGGGGGGGGGAW